MKSKILNILFWSVISAAFIGPGTVTTAAKAGADFGLPLLWALTFATIACLVLQEAASRLTIASGMNLGQAIRYRAGQRKKSAMVPVFVVVCILTGTAAYQAGNLLGAMSGLKLLVDIPAWLTILVLGIMAALLLLIPSVKVIARILGGIVAFMGITFLLSAMAIKPPIADVIRGMTRPIIPLNGGGGLLVLGLIGTTVVPYNLFLGSGISGGQSIREMRSGLLIAILLGGIISMAVLVTGSSMMEEFSFEGLARSLDEHIGGLGTIVLGVGLFAAGFTSAVTAPLASAVTVRSLFGNRDPEKWKDGSKHFRVIWISILVIGVAFGVVGFRPVPAIILAQALNGMILPFIAVFIMIAVNDNFLMKDNVNRLPGNILLTGVVFIALIIGITGMVRAGLTLFGAELDNWNYLMLIVAIVSFLILTAVLLKISNGKKDI